MESSRGLEIYNKPCQIGDWQHRDFQTILVDEFGYPSDIGERIERKHWEWALGFAALQRYGYLKPENRALGIACGHERFLYVLTRYLHHVTGIDQYGETTFAAKEAQVRALYEPESFAPFDYDHDRLELKRMDARQLEFPDDSFDILFSFSSIEHFGRAEEVVRSMKEAYRVLKPGGIYVLTVDYLFHQSWPKLPRALRWREAGELLSADEIKRLIIDSAGFEVRERLDFKVDPQQVTNVYDSLKDRSTTGCIHPHIYLNFQKWGLRRYLSTSFFLSLFKP